MNILVLVLVSLLLFFIYKFFLTGPVSKSNTKKKTSTSAERSIEGTVATVDELQDGEMKECSLGEGKILLIKRNGEFHAIGNKCTHYGASLITGALCDNRIRCPWHGACFNIETGDIEDFPGLDSIPTYDVRVEGNDIIVRAPPALLKKPSVTQDMTRRYMEEQKVFVIIGGGCAGATCAETLRKEGFTGRIVMINRENHYAYDRPKLSKNMAIPLDKITLRSAEFYENFDIEILNGVQVTELDPDTKSVKLSDGSDITYDKCVIATGADPQRLRFIPGNDGANIYPLRTIEDAHTIYNVVDGKNVLIVGSSFIGMETASCISKKASSITVIGMEKVPFERVLGLEIGEIMQRFHEINGVRFVMNAIVQEFVKQDNIVVSIKIKDGPELPCDVIILGAGVLPATDFVHNEKINKERDRSIIVNEFLNTGKDGLYAAGDIARYPFHLMDGKTVRIEHWGMAQIQGALVAKNMVHGDINKCLNIPFFWTTQYTKSLRYAGHALEYQRVIMDFGADPLSYENPKFAAYYINNGKVLAMCTMNRDPLCSQVAELLNKGITITEEMLDSSMDRFQSTEPLIKDLLTQAL